MKKIIPILLIFVSVLCWAFTKQSNNELPNSLSSDKVEGIQFIESNWNKALEEAKKQHKLIFLDAYASWCGPCKLLKKNTFPDKNVGSLFNENFINVAIDMEKGEGPMLSEKYKVNAYPTLIILDENGIPITYTKGYMSPTDLIAFGKFGLSKKVK
jgi:thioredoxin-related protein